MKNRSSHFPLRRLLFLLIAFLLITLPRAAQATLFFSDFSAHNGGADNVTGASWLAGAFTTDNAAYSQLSATLLLDQATAGAAELDLYSSIGLEPKTFVKAFTSPASYSSTLASTTFTASSVALTANTTYWLVLKANSGSFDWGWTDDFSILHDTGLSSDSGATWFTSDAYPYQFSVTGSTAPEPSGAVAGLILLTLGSRRRRR